MTSDPEKTFLASPQWKAAVEGAREGLAVNGYTASEDAISTVALSVLIRFIGAGGYEEAAVLETMAMVMSVLNKNEHLFEPRAQH